MSEQTPDSAAPEMHAQQAEADRAAGWDSRFGTAPGDHGLPVEGLEVTDTAPVVQ